MGASGFNVAITLFNAAQPSIRERAKQVLTEHTGLQWAEFLGPSGPVMYEAFLVELAEKSKNNALRTKTAVFRDLWPSLNAGRASGLRWREVWDGLNRSGLIQLSYATFISYAARARNAKSTPGALPSPAPSHSTLGSARAAVSVAPGAATVSDTVSPKGPISISAMKRRPVDLDAMAREQRQYVKDQAAQAAALAKAENVIEPNSNH